MTCIKQWWIYKFFYFGLSIFRFSHFNYLLWLLLSIFWKIFLSSLFWIGVISRSKLQIDKYASRLSLVSQWRGVLSWNGNRGLVLHWEPESDKVSVKIRLDFRQQYHLLQSKKMTDKLYTNYISRNKHEYQHVTEYFAKKDLKIHTESFVKGLNLFLNLFI